MFEYTEPTVAIYHGDADETIVQLEEGVNLYGINRI